MASGNLSSVAGGSGIADVDFGEMNNRKISSPVENADTRLGIGKGIDVFVYWCACR